MMYGNMMGGMILHLRGFIFWDLLLAALILLGFSFVIWMVAKKGEGWEIMLGRVLAVVLAIVVIITFVYVTVRIMSTPYFPGMMFR